MIEISNIFKDHPELVFWLLILMLPLPFQIINYIFKKTTFYKKYYKVTRTIDRIIKCICSVFFFIILPTVLRYKLLLSWNEKELITNALLCYFYLLALMIASIIILPGYFSYLKELSKKDLENIE